MSLCRSLYSRLMIGQSKRKAKSLQLDLSRKMLDEFLIESNGCLGDFSNESSTLAASNVSQSNVYKKSSPIPI